MTVQASVYQIQKETTTANAVLLDIKNNSDRGILHNQSNILATKTDMNELKSVVEALVASNSDTTLILKKLMSKPDALKVACRELPKEHPDQSLFRLDNMSDDLYSGEADGFYESLYCSCNTRRGLKRKTKRSGPAFLVREVVVETPHFSWCPLSASVHGQSKWSARISTRMLRGLASVALTVTTSTILGAGGFAISPSFTYLPIRETSPAREALRLLGKAFFGREWSDQDCKSLVWRTIKTIQASFNSRTSSPFDIDNDGNTLFHDVMTAWSRCNSNLPRDEIVKYLSAVGVPRDRPNQARIYPFQAALRSSIAVHTPPTQMFRMLCPGDCRLALDVQQAKIYGSKGWSTGFLKAHTEMIKKCPEFVELYSGHPTEAIISRNGAALQHALDRNVSLLELSEIDAFGNNSLNHLLSWPEGVRLVLDRFGSRVFDAPGETLILEYALFWSGYTCKSNTSTMCQNDCACTDVVKLILDVDVESLAKTTSRHYWMVAVARASVKAREVFIERLRDARQQLRALSLFHLAPQEIEKWDLRSPNILDYHTNSVIAALNRKEQLVPRRLATNVEPSHISRSVYRNIAGYGFDGASIADTFYQYGFHDIDTPDPDACHPLEVADNPNY
ncbi:Ankyrin repeat-containing protein, partial [Colletotrichum asianum]